MSSKIKLEFPYTTRYKFGYLVTNTENRQTLALYNSKEDRTSTQYARYLLAVSLGRFLTEEEQVDHIDGDKTNNSIDNLQILSKRDNILKSNKLSDVEMICPVCKIKFTKTRSELRGKLEKAFNNDVCCSRTCGGIKSKQTKP